MPVLSAVGVDMFVVVVPVVVVPMTGIVHGPERKPGVAVRAVMMMLVGPESVAVRLGPVHDASVGAPIRRLRSMRVPRLTSGGFRRLTTVNLVLLVAIIVSGAVVRLTNSGLGCRDWPNCSADQFVSVSTHHAAIEQLNRLFSGAIGLPIALALIGAYQLRPRRRDLVRLAWILFGLFWCEAILGGISVMVQLAWFSVMSHFLLALALVSVAMQMRQRAGEPEGQRRPIVAPVASRAVRVVYVWTIAAVIAGTFVTAAGPHGGDRDARRLTWPIVDLVRLHGTLVDLLVVITLVTVWLLVRTGAPRTVLATASLALAAMVAQGILGYVQYFEAIPAVLVGFHVFGAVLVFAGVQQLELSVRAPAPVSRVVDTPVGDHIGERLLGPDRSSVASATMRDPVA
jgi:cytochrome c oxidase assembly protein subunit 15